MKRKAPLRAHKPLRATKSLRRGSGQGTRYGYPAWLLAHANDGDVLALSHAGMAER